jgi:hypothetical protein
MNVDRRKFLLASGSACVALPLIARAGYTCGPVFFPGFGMRQACTSGIASNLATMFADYQTRTEWCWAASISMIFQYYGHSVSQERIVQETWGKIENLPGSNQQILSDLSRDWTDDDDIEFHTSCDAMSANPVTAAQDLAGNRPLIVCSLGHAMVLTALTYVLDPSAPGGGQVTSATVRDPWPSNGGRRILSPQEWYNISLLVRVRI